jgi:putative OPT family oligopeptide transporter
LAQEQAQGKAPPAFRPYISAEQNPAEFTARAVILGALFGILFASVSVYLGLKTGITVSASIPIAVLSITIFRKLGNSTILENNMVQTTGSAGESVAAGVVFTLPALVLLGFELEFLRVFLLALAGGWLGILFMIPLRRALIVKEHGVLKYPEGTACADILVAGEKGGELSKNIFAGLGAGILYGLLQKVFGIFKDTPEWSTKGDTYRGAAVNGEVTPELLGVGYVIGFRQAAIMVAGGVLSWLVFIPAIKFFGHGLTEKIYPGTKTIAEMDHWGVWSAYIRYIGAGGVAVGGLISLARSMPTIVNAFRAGIKDLSSSDKAPSTASTNPGAPYRDSQVPTFGDVPRTERDLPFQVVVGGGVVLFLVLWAILGFFVNPGYILGDAVASILIVVFSFFFVTVSSRICGLIGSSSNPVSGMTIATLMATCVTFLLAGWTETNHPNASFSAVALSIGAVVCISAAIGGATSQDLKTGYLVGATPRAQQIALMIGSMTSVLVIGAIVIFANVAYTRYLPSELSGKAFSTGPGIHIRKVADLTGKEFAKVTLSDEAAKPLNVAPGVYLAVEEEANEEEKKEGATGAFLLVFTGGETSEPVAGVVRVRDNAPGVSHQGRSPAKGYTGTVISVIGNSEIPDGSYLAQPTGGQEAGQPGAYTIQLVHEDGVGGKKLPAPKAGLMALLINGFLNQKLPWALVLLGVFIAVTMELCGIAALPFAVGLYLPLSTSTPIFAGGIIRHFVDARRRKAQGLPANGEEEASDEAGSGVLYASGLIAGGALAGLVISFLTAGQLNEATEGIGKGLWASLTGSGVPAEVNDIVAVMAFAALGFSLFRVADKDRVKKPTPTASAEASGD